MYNRIGSMLFSLIVMILLIDSLFVIRVKANGGEPIEEKQVKQFKKRKNIYLMDLQKWITACF